MKQSTPTKSIRRSSCLSNNKRRATKVALARSAKQHNSGIKLMPLKTSTLKDNSNKFKGYKPNYWM